MRIKRLLLDDDRQRCAEALWAPKHRELGLPGNTVFRAGAFLSLPTPEDVDAEAAVSASLLTGAPLTDQVVSDGALAYAFEDTAFKLSETQVVAEIARLHAFVADHGAAPKHLISLAATELGSSISVRAWQLGWRSALWTVLRR